MKNKIKDQVLEFMKETNTSDYSNNKFVFEYYKTLTWDSIINEEQFLNWPSISSITRSRRLITKIYWLWKRTNADTEKEYQKEFCLDNKF